MLSVLLSLNFSHNYNGDTKEYFCKVDRNLKKIISRGISSTVRLWINKLEHYSENWFILFFFYWAKWIESKTYVSILFSSMCWVSIYSYK